MIDLQNNLSIKSLAEEDRPREKLMLKGKHNLSNAELLAILLGSGSRKESALRLSQRILKSVDYNLYDLGKCSIQSLMKFKGVGEVKAISIVAACEFGRRRQQSEIKERPQILGSLDAYNIIGPQLMDLEHEEFWLLLLNRSNRVIGQELVSVGGVAGTIVDAKIVFKKAIEVLASSIVLCHNHPSGNLNPSQADINITKRLQKAGQTLDIAIVDHIIVSENGYTSFVDAGLF